ncbi:MAG: cytochrome c biogenesis protein CcsA [Phycisphaerae bacterium]
MSTQHRFRVRAIDVMVVALIVGYGGYKASTRPSAGSSPQSGFEQAVDLSPLYETAVQADGRIRSFESHARALIGLISGSRLIDGQSYGFTYLDLIFRPQSYLNRKIVYIKNKLVRAQFADTLQSQNLIDRDESEAIRKTGLVSPTMLNHPAILALRSQLGKDLIRTAKDSDAIETALHVSNARLLLDRLRVLPPQDADAVTPWASMDELAGNADMPGDATHAGLAPKPGPIPGIDPATQEGIAKAWTSLKTAWLAENADEVNTQIATLARHFASTTSELYPAAGRLKMESWYFRNKSMTWVWLVYLLSVLPLLMSLIYKWDRARTIGMVMFVVAFALHTASLGIRWYISGRWPNSNMFEAVTTAAWFGGVGAIVLEWIARKTAFRNIFALGSAVMSMVALMACYYMPAVIDSAIRNKMAALNDIWLYIHTNVIIWSYAVIGLGCIPALLMLRHRWCTLWDSGTVPKWRLFLLPIALGVLNYAVWILTLAIINPTQYGLDSHAKIVCTGMLVGSLSIVFLEFLAARDRAAAGIRVERSAAGGAAALIGDGGGFAQPEKPSAGQVFDGATMVLVEVAFIMLWTGTVMGAIWADHSWGRPWGWDPKEVFALNTFIIFIVLVHVRLKVRDKALWTAILAVVGFEVMLFNWIVVNFIITGLHSYA